MGCDCGKPKCDGHCGVSPAVLQINNPSECVLFHRVEVPASMGDSKTNPPKSGAYKNVLLYYEADQTSWLYSSDGVPQKLVNGLTDYEDAINLPQINGVTLLGNKTSSQLGIGDLFYINVTNVDFDEGTFTADKTYAEILEAYNAGKLPIVIVKEEDSSYLYNGIYMLRSYGVNDESDGFDFVYVNATGSEGRVDAGSWVIHIGNNESRAAESYGHVEIDPSLNQYSDHAISNSAVTNALLSRAVVFDTVADMKQATNFVVGSYARTLGFHSINDGGGALYKITDTGTANDMDIIAIDSLFANLILGNEISVKQLGAYGDNTHDDSNAIIQALTFNVPLYLPAGRYKLTQAINIGNKIVHGAGQFKTFIRAYNDISGNVITLSSDHAKLQDFTLESPDYDYSVVGTTNQNTGIYIYNYHHITMENVRVVGFNYGIYAGRAWCLSCYDVMCLCCNKGLYGIDEFNNTLFERCIFNTCIAGFHFQGGFGNLFNACDFEKNTDGVFTDGKGDLTFDGCYFENNTSSALHIGWGLNPINAITINSSTFWVNAQCDGLIKYHARPDTPIVLRDCTFRNNDTLEAGSKPIFIKEHSTQCLPHIIGGEIGASFSVLDDIWVDKLGAKSLTATDWITAGENITIGNFALYEDNKHIFGWLSFTSTTAYPAGTATTLGVLKDKYKPAVNVNSYGVLTDNQWQQTSDNVCYLYISGPSIQTRDGDGTCKTIKAYIDYVRK